MTSYVGRFVLFYFFYFLKGDTLVLPIKFKIYILFLNEVTIQKIIKIYGLYNARY